MSLLSFILANKRWLFAGALLTFLSSFGQTFFIAIFAGELRAEFGLTHGDWGWIYLLGTMSSGFLMIWAGGLADHFRVRVLAFAMLMTLALVCLMMSWVTSVWLLPLVIFGLRFSGQGMISHIAVVAMARWYVQARGKAIAVAGAGYALGEALLPMLFVSLLVGGDWRYLWQISAAVCLLAIPILFWVLQRERTPSELAQAQDATGMRERHWSRREAVADWRLWGLVPIAMVVSIFGTALFFQQVHLADAKGASHADIVRLFPIYTGVTAVAAILAGMALDRFGAVQMLPFVPLPMAVGFTVIGLSEGIGAAGIGFALVGITGGMQATVGAAFWPEVYGTRYIGAIKALATALMVIGSAIGPALTGWIIDLGADFPQQMIWYAGYMVLVSGWTYFVCGRVLVDMRRS